VRGVPCLVLGSVARVSCAVSLGLLVPCGKGVRPPFIDQGRSESHARRAIELREGA
jgi:hypothetical protein